MTTLASTPGLLLGFVFLALSFGALVTYLVALWATRSHLRAVPRRSDDLPPVSLLKPIKGLEDELAQNLQSFFAQDYPRFEIVFAAADPRDPGLAVARRLAASHPQVPCRFVITDEDFGLNPKVANLAGALEVARFDLVHQSDANVRVEADYLRRIVGELRAADASVLTSVVVGVGEKSVGAAMENLQLSAYIAPAMCLVLRAVDITCVCGKSMLFYRSELERDLGGLHSVRNVLCEDFVLGERYKALGKRVLLSSTTVANVNGDCGVDRFVGRHGRWLKMRITLHLPGFLADLFSNPIALAFVALVVSSFDARVALGAAAITVAKTCADRLGLRITRTPMTLRYAWLTPVKDLILLPLWINAIFSRTVEWRGRRLRFGKDTQLFPLEPTTEPALAPAFASGVYERGAVTRADAGVVSEANAA